MSQEVVKTTPDAKRQPRLSNAAAPQYAPLVSAQRGKFTMLPEVKIEGLAATQLEAYRAFVKDVEGAEPEAGAVISASLEMLFEADQGFARWLQEQRKKGYPLLNKMSV